MTRPRLRTALVLLAVAGGSAVTTAAGSAPASVPTCSSSNLAVHFEGTDGTAGTLHDVWRLANVGPTCRIRGWVNAVNFGRDGRPLPTTVRHAGGPARMVVLAHGRHVSWSFGYPDPGIVGCTPERPVAMVITPPSNALPVLAPRGEPACRGVLDATPLVAGG